MIREQLNINECDKGKISNEAAANNAAAAMAKIFIVYYLELHTGL